MKVRKKPVEVEAVQFTNDNKDRAFTFVTCNCSPSFNDAGQPILKIQTLEGVMTANINDWIIKGVAGEFYPCKPDMFEKTYEVMDG
jgi:hypothetical protein